MTEIGTEYIEKSISNYREILISIINEILNKYNGYIPLIRFTNDYNGILRSNHIVVTYSGGTTLKLSSLSTDNLLNITKVVESLSKVSMGEIFCYEGCKCMVLEDQFFDNNVHTNLRVVFLEGNNDIKKGSIRNISVKHYIESVSNIKSNEE